MVDVGGGVAAIVGAIMFLAFNSHIPLQRQLEKETISSKCVKGSVMVIVTSRKRKEPSGTEWLFGDD